MMEVTVSVGQFFVGGENAFSKLYTSITLNITVSYPALGVAISFHVVMKSDRAKFMNCKQLLYPYYQKRPTLFIHS